MITIEFGSCTDAKNKVNKTFNVLETVHGSIHEDFSELEPLLTVSIYSPMWNYCHIGDKYYYINRVVRKTNNLTELSLYEDVLMSYKDYIKVDNVISDDDHTKTNAYFEDKFNVENNIFIAVKSV